jgi:hypothetical protein
MDLDQSFSESEGRCRQPNTPWRGELFHPRRQMGGLAHGAVVHMEIIANRPHHDFAGVEPDAGLHLQAVGAADFLSVAAKRGLHR